MEIKQNQSDSKDLVKQNDTNLDTLTEQNWLFIKYFLNGHTIAESYRLAKYEGKDDSAPYNLYYHLKKRIALIQEAGSVDRVRLLKEAKQLLDMPLKEDKTSVTFSEKLRTIKVVANLVPEMKEVTPVHITNFTINRYVKPIDPSKVIDVKEVTE